MILDAEEIEARINSPFNLLNRLQSVVHKAESIVTLPMKVQEKSEPSQVVSIPSIDDLVENADDKINKATAISGAKALMAESINRLRSRLIEVDNPVQLSRIATDMNKIVHGDDERGNKNQMNAPIVIWKPEVHNEAHYETIVVSD